MPLDPQAAALLEMMAGAPQASLDERPVTESRARSAAASIVSAEPVHSVTDHLVRTDATEVRVRSYRPAADDGLPILLWFHGGAFVMGDLGAYDDHCRVLANRSGCIVVAVDYRLAPEHPFPAAAEDAYAATTWAADHAVELGGDPERIAVAGDSAGGNLAAVTCLMARDRRGPAIRFQLLIYPMLDPTFDGASRRDFADGHLFTARDMAWAWEQYVPDPSGRHHPYVSPAHATDLADLPPALIVTAQYDPLRDEGEHYAAALADAGGTVELRRYPGQIHGFIALRLLIEAGDLALTDIAEDLRAALAPTRAI